MDKHPLRVAFEARDLPAMVDTLAPDVVFRSPVISSSFHGRDEVRELFEIVLQDFQDFEYTNELVADDSRVLVFNARVRDRPVQGVQVLDLDDQGQIRELRVMARPLAGLAAIAAVVGGRLAKARGRARYAAVETMMAPLLALTAAIDAGAARLAQDR